MTKSRQYEHKKTTLALIDNMSLNRQHEP